MVDATVGEEEDAVVGLNGSEASVSGEALLRHALDYRPEGAAAALNADGGGKQKRLRDLFSFQERLRGLGADGRRCPFPAPPSASRPLATLVGLAAAVAPSARAAPAAVLISRSEGTPRPAHLPEDRRRFPAEAADPRCKVLENPFDVDSDIADRQTALLSTSGHSSGNSSGSDDWIEPAAYVLNSTALLSRQHKNVLDAFRLLQKDPTVQKMVMSLSCDKAVWSAVMNDEEFQDFRRSLHDDTLHKILMHLSWARLCLRPAAALGRRAACIEARPVLRRAGHRPRAHAAARRAAAALPAAVLAAWRLAPCLPVCQEEPRSPH
ncbi:hypothetical protein C2845_PM10G08940 [Panicum miliaceum]|uniref:Uncharacterized protein n=1 Tax=Panicum miliaceum TaxID=4540 RepID=A0A3L6PDW8_PANMI|nr:hypothetical protein C2845_PM10G08940 [Panicum miliaceum]